MSHDLSLGTETKTKAKVKPPTLAMALDIMNQGGKENFLIASARATPQIVSLVGCVMMPILSQYKSTLL